MRVALVVNRASGGGRDPAPLVRAMSEHGAEVTTYDAVDRDERDAYALVVGS